MPELEARGMSGYEKRLLDESGTKYEIWEIYSDGHAHKVKETQDIYQKWLGQGNSPTVIPYTPPTPPPWNIQRQAAYRGEYSYDELCEAVFEYVIEDRPDKMNAIQTKRLAVKQAIPKPE